MDMPYAGLNELLGYLALGALLGAAAFGVMAARKPKGERRKPFGFAGLCVLGFVLFGAANYVLISRVQLPELGRRVRERQRQRRDDASRVKLGDAVPAFELTTLLNKRLTAESLRGKVVVINFFATWCGPCLQELPHVQALWNRYRTRNDFELVVIGREEGAEKIEPYLAEHGFTFPTAADPKRAVYSLFATEGVPRTYVVSQAGTVVYAAAGFTPGDEIALQQVVEENLAR